MRTVLMLLAAAMLLGACERGPARFSEPQHSADSVLKIVNDQMTSRGKVMPNYELDSLSFDYVDRKWSVFFSGKSQLVGDHFTVRVTDANGQVEVVPGL